MFTLALLDFIFSIFNSFLIRIFGNVIPTISNITQFFIDYRIPNTLLEIFKLCVLFLPTGTIAVLFGMTFIIIVLKLLIAVLHTLSLGFLFKS